MGVQQWAQMAHPPSAGARRKGMEHPELLVLLYNVLCKCLKLWGKGSRLFWIMSKRKFILPTIISPIHNTEETFTMFLVIIMIHKV